MRYRDAKKLKNGDEVIRKEDQAVLTVESTEVFWLNKVVKINCFLKPLGELAATQALNTERYCLFNDEAE